MTLLFIFSAPIFFDLFANDFFNEKTPSAGVLNRSEDIPEQIILSEPNRNSTDCTILDN